MGWSMRIKLLSLLFLISFATGQGSSLSFDGVNDYVSIANNSAFEPSSFTVQAWINLDAFENEDYFVYRHKTWFIGFSRSGTKFEGGVRDDDGGCILNHLPLPALAVDGTMWFSHLIMVLLMMRRYI